MKRQDIARERLEFRRMDPVQFAQPGKRRFRGDVGGRLGPFPRRKSGQ